MTTMYKITKLWLNPGQEADPTKWIDPSTWERGFRGPHMNPNTKTGRMNILIGMDSRLNHNTLRTFEGMLRFYETCAVQVGMQNPQKVAKNYLKYHLNEGLIEEINVASLQQAADEGFLFG